MDRFDEMLRRMAEKEECIVPEGFEKRVEDALDSLPPKAKRVGLGAAKRVFIAVAVCAALLGTAFAASPGLREMLSTALGGFAPYAQEQDSGVYTWDNFEIKVLSAIADENTIRVYTSLTDLNEERRTYPFETWLAEAPWIDIYVPNTSVDITGGCGSTTFDRCDGATQTTMAVTTLWGEITNDLTGAELRIDTPLNRMDGKAAVTIPLNVKVMASKTLFRDVEIAGTEVEEIRVSPLGIMVITRKEGNYTRTGLDTTFSICLKDGIRIETEHDGTSGHGVYKTPDGAEHETLIWNFREPVELDQIAGVYIGEDYFPVK